MGIFEQFNKLSKVKENNIRKQLKPGSSEIWYWLHDFDYAYKYYPRLIQYIYDQMVYNQVAECCNDEQLYELINYVKKYDLGTGTFNFMRDLRHKLEKDKYLKERMINMQLNNEKIEFEQIEREIQEEEKLVKLKKEHEEELKMKKRIDEIKVRNGIPTTDMLFNGKIISQYNDGNGTEYRILDSIFDKYHGIVFSQSRKKSDGTYDYRVLSNKNLNQLEKDVMGEFNQEQIRQKEFMYKTNMKKLFNDRKNISLDEDKNIKHVKDIMGINDFPDDLNGGDVF